MFLPCWVYIDILQCQCFSKKPETAKLSIKFASTVRFHADTCLYLHYSPYPQLMALSFSMFCPILSLSSWAHLRAPATGGMFLLITGPEGERAANICWSKIILAWSSSWLYMASRIGYLYWKSLWIRGRSSRGPIISRSLKQLSQHEQSSKAWQTIWERRMSMSAIFLLNDS